MTNGTDIKQTEWHIKHVKVHGGDFYLQASERNEIIIFISERAQETGSAFNRYAP